MSDDYIATYVRWTLVQTPPLANPPTLGEWRRWEQDKSWKT